MLRRPLRHPFRPGPLALASALMLLALAAPQPAQSQRRTGVDWTYWLAKGPGQVLGSVALGDGSSVDVTFSGAYDQAFTGRLPEPYWGPDNTYLGTRLANAPPREAGVITVVGGPDSGTMELSFSQAVTDPVIAIASLGLTTASRSIDISTSLVFEQPFEVLSNGPNFYAGGQYTRFVQAGNTLSGIESSGVIRFRGTFESIRWTSPLREENAFGNVVGTYLFSLGTAGCHNVELTPNPLDVATVVRAGCSFYTLGSHVQAAPLTVRGSLEALGAFSVDNPLAVATGGSFVAMAGLDIAPSAVVTLGGSLNAAFGGTVQVAGQLHTTAGSSLRANNLFVAAGGAVTVAGGGQLGGLPVVRGHLVLAPGGGLLVTGPLVVDGSGALLDVQADLARAGRLDMAYNQLAISNGATVRVGGELVAGTLALGNATLQVAAGGTLGNANGGQLAGTVSNQGSLLQAAGTLEASAGAITNQGQWRVQNGTLAIGGTALFNNLTGATLEAGRGGTIAWQGGGFSNLGTVAAAAGGILSVQGVVLSNGGQLQVAPGGRLDVLAGALVNGGTVNVQGQFLNTALVTNNHQFSHTVADSDSSFNNQGQFLNQGSLVFGSTSLNGGVARNSGLLRNTGTLHINAGATLINDATVFNDGLLQVDGFLSLDGGLLIQSASGHTRVNGVVRTSDTVIFAAGRVSGTGVFDGNMVLGHSAVGAPGQSPGTLQITGDLLLQDGAVLELEIAERGPSDQLRVGGLLRADAGSTIALQFVGGTLPGLDQSVELLRSAQGLNGLNIGAATLTGLPDSRFIETYQRAGANGSTLLAWAFTPQDAQRWTADQFGLESGVMLVGDGALVYADSPLGQRSGALVVQGTLGLRHEATLQTAVLQIDSGGQLRSSSSNLRVPGRLVANGLVLNRGQLQAAEVQVGAGGSWQNRGNFVLGDADVASPLFENRGLARHDAGLWQNQPAPGQAATIRNLAGATLQWAATVRGTADVVNAGRLVVEAGGDVQDLRSFWQDAGSTQVDGWLAADEAQVNSGVLGGSGTLAGHWRVGWAGGDTGPVVLRPGSAASDGPWGGTLRVAGGLELGPAALVEFLVSDSQQHGRLQLDGHALFEVDSGFRFVLLDGWQPGADTVLQILDFNPDLAPIGLDTALAGNSAVLVRNASGDSLWKGGTWTWQARDNGIDLLLSAAPVPEPGTGALLLAGVAVVVGVQRRRQRWVLLNAPCGLSRPRTARAARA